MKNIDTNMLIGLAYMTSLTIFFLVIILNDRKKRKRKEFMDRMDKMVKDRKKAKQETKPFVTERPKTSKPDLQHMD